MHFKTLILVILSLTLFISPIFAESDKKSDADKNAMKEFLRSDVVSGFVETSYAYAIFPNIGKGGFGIGGAHGKGRVYLNSKKVGTVSMTQISIGLQAGGQAYRQVIFFQDKRAYEDFTSGNFEFGAQAAAIAITSSAGVSAGTEGNTASADASQAETDYHKGMIVFTMGKGGLMFQASIGGQKYKFKPNK
jgi:lipid-binding SYLF domain-containing protein